MWFNIAIRSDQVSTRALGPVGHIIILCRVQSHAHATLAWQIPDWTDFACLRLWLVCLRQHWDWLCRILEGASNFCSSCAFIWSHFYAGSVSFLAPGDSNQNWRHGSWTSSKVQKTEGQVFGQGLSGLWMWGLKHLRVCRGHIPFLMPALWPCIICISFCGSNFSNSSTKTNVAQCQTPKDQVLQSDMRKQEALPKIRQPFATPERNWLKYFYRLSDVFSPPYCIAFWHPMFLTRAAVVQFSAKGRQTCWFNHSILWMRASEVADIALQFVGMLGVSFHWYRQSREGASRLALFVLDGHVTDLIEYNFI